MCDGREMAGDGGALIQGMAECDKGAGSAERGTGWQSREEKGVGPPVSVHACMLVMRPACGGRELRGPTFTNACLVVKLPPLTFFCI